MAQRGTPLSAYTVRQIQRLLPLYGVRKTARVLSVDTKTVMKYSKAG